MQMMSGKYARIPVILLVVMLGLSGDVSCDLSDCPLQDWPFPFGDVIVDDGELYENFTMAAELTTLTFTCFDGYSMFGAPRVQCWEGNWSSELPVCAKSECSNPVAVENARVVLKQGNSADSMTGSFAKYSCVDGYELVNPDASILVCSLDRENRKVTWEGEMPICEKSGCSNPVAVEHATVVVKQGDSADSVIGSVAEYSCVDDYELVNPEASILVCSLDRENGKVTWEGEKPICEKSECSNSVVVEHATVVIKHVDSADFVIRSIAEYSCVDGYELVNPDSSYLVCFLDRQTGKTTWQGEKPICRKKLYCDDPGVSPNGERVGNCCSSGDTLRFTCNSNYELVGKEEILCLRSGNWSSDRPLCRPLHSEYCEFPDPIANGELKGRKAGDYFVPGEKVEVRCNPGYKCEGDDVAMCEEGGRWAKEFGICKEIFCDPPTPVAHGKIFELQTTNLTKFPYGYDISYVCDKGYRIVRGDSWRRCTYRSVWSGKNPTCDLIRCPDPGSPENGLKSGSNHSVGSRIRFKCDSGYELLGSMEILCQANGKWAGELTRCNLPSNYCPDPGTPVMGSRIMPRHGIEMGDIVRFRCNPRTILLGSAVRECLPNGTWSGSPTTCVGLYDFDNVADVKDRLVMTMMDIKDQTIGGSSHCLNFTGMTILYFAFDVSSSITKTNFEKSVKFAKAVVREVGVSPNKTSVGAVKFGNTAEGIFLPFEYETVEDVLNALDAIEYTGGSLLPISVLSFIRREYMPVVKAGLDNLEIKSVLFILTDGRANMGGNPKKEAKLLKAEGVDIYCVGITGDIMNKVLYDIASTSKEGEVTKPNVFMLQDYDTLEWLVQEITYGTANYSMCGLGKENVGGGDRRLVGGQRVTEPWPWMAALNMTEKPNRPEKSVLCGGSIISKNFILTAAHCMYYSKIFKRRKEDDITVKLGVIHLDDDKHLQELEVRKINVHENFFMEGLDYDIAILELRTPIQYNAYVRPICLPPKEIPENNPYYKPQSTVWVAGWGHTSMLEKYEKPGRINNKHLKETALPIQSWETCRESILEDGKYYFSESMFCAGTGKERNDTCFGYINGDIMSGGPVMYRQLNKDGYVSWTQIGIVNWEMGCSLEVEYGIYVHLQKLMPWVERTMKDANDFGN